MFYSNVSPNSHVRYFLCESQRLSLTSLAFPGSQPKKTKSFGKTLRCMVVSHSFFMWRSTVGPTTIDRKHPPFPVWKYKVKGDDLLSVTKVQIAWLPSFCPVYEEHQDTWILVSLSVQWVCVCLLLFHADDCACRGCFFTSRRFIWQVHMMPPFFPTISFLTLYLASAILLWSFIDFSLIKLED